MTTIETAATTLQLPETDLVIDEARLAAVASLARYSGRTLDAYRDDLRGFFQWTTDNELAVLAVTGSSSEMAPPSQLSGSRRPEWPSDLPSYRAIQLYGGVEQS